MLAAALHEAFWGRLAACSALRPLAGTSPGVDGFCIGAKLVRGRELSVGFSSSCVTTAARLGNSKTCGFFPPWILSDWFPQAFPSVRFGLVLSERPNVSSVVWVAPSPVNQRLILCLKKWWQDRALGYEHSPAQPVFAFSFVQCQKFCS